MDKSFCIRTDRLVIKRLNENCAYDLKQIWESINKTVYAQYDKFHSTEIAKIHDTVKRWALYAESFEHMFFAVYLDEKMIGFYAFHKRDIAFETGYAFNAEYHCMGYAKESFVAILDYLISINIRRFTAGTALENIPSVNLLKSVGFKLIKVEKVSFYKDIHGNNIFFDGGVFELNA